MRRSNSSVCLILLGALIAGCKGGNSPEAYIPSPDAGKQALDAALSAWKAGKPMTEIKGDQGPAISPLDSDWKANKKLASYTIGNEIPTTEGPKQFSVKLTFQGDPKQVDATYYVVGINPLWVFRDTDYKHHTGM